MTREVDVVVLGAGAAGLATAACLRRRGLDPVVLDRGDHVGQVWHERYDRLHLHTPRVQSALPGLRLPAGAGRWVARDDFAAYLAGYAQVHRIRPQFGHDVERVVRRGGRWDVRTSAGSFRVRELVVATGHANSPALPDWGRGSVRVVHSAAYRNPGRLGARSVLVAGAGNSGAEIVVDLLEHGVADVLWSVRTPPPVVPRSLGPVPATLLTIVQQPFPTALVDPLSRWAAARSVGDLSAHGLPPARIGPVARTRTTGEPPVIDVGIVAALRAGRVRVVPAVTRLEGADVVLAEGSRHRPDVVVAATGFSPALGFLEHPDLLDRSGRPRTHGGASTPGAPGLRFVGFRVPARGALFEAGRDARAAARAITRRA
ncbi:flavin-containing monooxygenase [Kineococcus rhizosphaerae]|uniref:flavin-containing monooxygenase n=1 Tax=Kineococcus rhizosphaerae TaxID=559628 RepID=UPI001B805DFC|nr:NAD(P)/FAD-dependent oxidoreductase [Kineococcus rhizosphaerae]